MKARRVQSGRRAPRAEVGWLHEPRHGGGVSWLVVRVEEDPLVGRPVQMLSLAQAQAVARELGKVENRRN